MRRQAFVPGFVSGIILAVAAGGLTISSLSLVGQTRLDSRSGAFVSQPQVLSSEINSIDTATPSPSAQVPHGVSPDIAVTTSQTPTPTPLSRPNPLQGRRLYVDPRSQAALAEATLRSTNPAQAELIHKIAKQPQAKWLNGPSDTGAALTAYLKTVSNDYPVIVVYYIPARDCGATNQQGAPSSVAYRQWIDALAATLGAKPAALIIEPDALARLDCLPTTRQTERLADLRYAAQVFGAKPNLAVYLDAGHAQWLSVAEAAQRLGRAGIEAADGFSLGVSHFVKAAQNTTYGLALSAATGGQHFVIDTSRSGQGEAGNGQWCNPPGRGLGPVPQIAPGPANLDAYLWVKRPGESDGTCNGGPGAGLWWLDYALGLVQKAS